MIPRRLGTPKGTCYYYFPTRESLAQSVIEQSNAGIAAAMGPIWESDAPPMHKLIAATFRFIAVTESDPVVRVGYQLREAMRQISDAGPRSFGQTEAIFASALKTAIDDGHVRADVNPQEAGHPLRGVGGLPLAGGRLSRKSLRPVDPGLANLSGRSRNT